MSPLSTAASIDDYLSSSYKPDLEFIDGVLKEKPMPTRLHAFVQAMLIYWFAMHMDEWNIMPLSEVRTRVSPKNFRLPDLAVTFKSVIHTKTQEDPPLIAIEVVSDDDRFSDLRDRARDFYRMGVPNIWLIDPETHDAFFWGGTEEGAWILTRRLHVDQSPIHLDLSWLWSKVEEFTPKEHNTIKSGALEPEAGTEV